MRGIVEFALITLLTVPALAEGRFEDGETGLVVAVPDGWEREVRREHGSIRFSGTYEVAPKKYVAVTIETADAAGFDEARWLEFEKGYQPRYIETIESPFTTEAGVSIGGGTARRYTVAGKTGDHALRIRASGVVRNGAFFRIREVSYNDAHLDCAEAIDDLWQGIAFQEADSFQAEPEDSLQEDTEESGAVDVTPEGGLAAQVVEDKPGNYHLKLPAGWEVVREPQEDPAIQWRAQAMRKTVSQGEVMSVEVWRVTTSRAETFTIDTPGDVLNRIRTNDKFFERFFGEGSASVVQPEVDESKLLGGAEKSGEFVMSSITMQEQAKVDKAMKLRARGDKSAEVPVFKPQVIRGRVALISPNIYFVFAHFRRDVSENEVLLAEYEKIMEEFQFLTSDELPGPLNVMGEGVGNTVSDPANAKDRKESKVYSERARKAYNLELKFTVPAHFARAAKGENGNRVLMLVAQDEKNNWLNCEVWCVSARRVGEENKKLRDKKEQFEEWASNWESKARGVKVPRKPQKFSLGKVRGAGYKTLEGNVEGFRGTFRAVLQDKSGWRTWVTVETRGEGDRVFEDGLKKFLKSLKIKPVK